MVWTWEGRDLSHAMCSPREFDMRRMQSFPCHMFTLIVRKMQSFLWYVFTLMIWAREGCALSRVMWLLWHWNDYLDGLNTRKTRSFSCYMITLMIWIWEGCIFLTFCDSLDGIGIPRIIHQSHWCSMGRSFIERRFGVSYRYLVLFARAIGIIWEDLSSNADSM